MEYGPQIPSEGIIPSEHITCEILSRGIAFSYKGRRISRRGNETMKIIKIYPKTSCDGIVVELEDKTKRVFTRTLLAVLNAKDDYKNIIGAKIPIDDAGHSCKGIKRITSLDDVSLFSKEDLRTLLNIEYGEDR